MPTGHKRVSDERIDEVWFSHQSISAFKAADAMPLRRCIVPSACQCLPHGSRLKSVGHIEWTSGAMHLAPLGRYGLCTCGCGRLFPSDRPRAVQVEGSATVTMSTTDWTLNNGQRRNEGLGNETEVT